MSQQPSAVVITDPSTKVDLIELLHGIRNTVLYAFVLEDAVKDKEALAMEIDGLASGFQMPGGEIHREGLSPLAAQLRDLTARKVLSGNLSLILSNDLIRTTHEVVVMYCTKSKELEAYVKAPFYQFARVARNLVSHHEGAILNRWPESLFEKSITSVHWRNRTISSSDVGKHVFISIGEAFVLHRDIAEFVVMELK